jgi:hypothetical protein
MGEHVAHEVHAGVRRGPHPSRKKCKKGCRQPLEIERGGCQISLDFRVGEAAPDGARKSVPCLGLAVKALNFLLGCDEAVALKRVFLEGLQVGF